jgi:hypothetical protein
MPPGSKCSASSKNSSGEHPPGKTPDLLLFDEPCSALYPLTRAYIEGTRG